jgi:hypothetical protein
VIVVAHVNPSGFGALSDFNASQRLALSSLVGILQAFSVEDLDSVDPLDFAATTAPVLLTMPGVTLGGTSPIGAQSQYVAARNFNAGASQWVPNGGVGSLVKALTASPRPAPTPTVVTTPTPINLPPGLAFWAASEIRLPDGCLIVIHPPVVRFVLMAKHLVVGNGVTISWARPLSRVGSPGVAGVVGATGAAGVGGATDGLPGGQGGAGGPGDPGWLGATAPAVEIWAYELDRTIWTDLAGQDGGIGGEAGKGGKGGRGGDGSPEITGFLNVCIAGAGSGGPGGPGGPGGSGGSGGSGGGGGDITVYGGVAATSAFTQSAIVDLGAGRGGQGGERGLGGDPGDGGVAGARPHNCAPGVGRIIHDGTAGSVGPVGSPGVYGPASGYHGTLTTTEITEADWDAEFSRPHVVQVNPVRVFVGATVTLTGTNFRSDDVVKLGGVPCDTTYLSDSTVKFTVPDVPGAVNPPVTGVVAGANGGETKPFGLEVLPSVTSITPGSAGVGAVVTVSGTGFPDNARVLLDGESQPSVSVTGTDALTFEVRMPSAPRSAGSLLSVGLADGTTSNSVVLRIVASQVFAVGDSIMWGQGLLPNQKFSTMVTEKWSPAGSAPTVAAHSGATIGVGDPTQYGPIDGEVPTSYPTVLKQVELFTGDPNEVGLVLVNGGINDCDIRTILSPFSTELQLTDLADKYCGQSMTVLLDSVCLQFPLAKVCVTGYYQLLSADSLANATVSLIVAFLSSLDVMLGIASNLGVNELAEIAARCGSWADTANNQIRQAAADASSRHSRNIVFADPGFGESNAVFASKTLVFGLNVDLSPQDPVSATRKTACQLAGARTDETQCERASLGHPDPEGAKIFAATICSALGLT